MLINPKLMKCCILLLILTSIISFSCSREVKSQLRSEAEARAQNWWTESVARCGDYNYLRVQWSDFFMNNLVERDALFQFKPSFASVKEKTLTEADKLNGFEWEGTIQIPVVAHRYYDFRLNKWIGWLDGAPMYEVSVLRPEPTPILGTRFYKVKGKWSIDGKFIRPNCAELPPG